MEMFVIIVLFVLLILSDLFLVVMVRQHKMIREKIEQLGEDLFLISEILDELSEHIEIVHEMEDYYGDVVLQNLMQHVKDVRGQIEQYSKFLSSLKGTESESEKREEKTTE